jgi:HSP20 family protein
MVEKTEDSRLFPSLYEPFRMFGTRVADWLNPATEASGGNGAYNISMELPGVNLDDIELSVEDGVVTVRGEKKTEQEKKGETWYFSERQYGAFRRSFRLPADADPANVKATMKDGVLNISAQKLPEQTTSAARKIEIGSA